MFTLINQVKTLYFSTYQARLMDNAAIHLGPFPTYKEWLLSVLEKARSMYSSLKESNDSLLD